MAAKTHILSTRNLEERLVQAAAAKDIQIDVYSYIAIESRKDEATLAAIKTAAAKKAIIVFTSRNAVEAVTNVVSFIPDWQIATLGGATRSAAAAFFSEEKIILAASTGKELLQQLVALGSAIPVLFFAGNRRLDTIPMGVQEAGIDFEEIIVYDTVDTPRRETKTYNSILFMSPSAVESFFSCNRIEEAVVLFAIGETTATTIRQHVPNKIIISGVHSPQQLVQKIIDYYV